MSEHVIIMVAGDLGRSPRMLCHAESSAKCGFQTRLIGYKGSKIPDHISQNPKIKVIAVPSGSLDPFPPWSFPLLRPFLSAFRSIMLFSAFIFAFFENYSAKTTLIVQNPPLIHAFPALLFWKLFSSLKKLFGEFSARGVPGAAEPRLVLDWHNLGHSIAALGRGEESFAVKLYKAAEYSLGRMADSHLCVTEALKRHLEKALGAGKKRIAVLMDQPNAVHLRSKPAGRGPSGPSGARAMTKFIVSATSWTADENFDILLDAVEILDRFECGEYRFVFKITGKGPLKAHYEAKIQKMQLRRCRVETVWLEDYRAYSALLRSCDAGVSLHASSSGLDLPMKVLDMFGCGLPVFAKNFRCLGELLQHGRNGLVFETPEELARLVYAGFVAENGEGVLESIRRNVENENIARGGVWDRQWRECVQRE